MVSRQWGKKLNMLFEGQRLESDMYNNIPGAGIKLNELLQQEVDA